MRGQGSLHLILCSGIVPIRSVLVHELIELTAANKWLEFVQGSLPEQDGVVVGLCTINHYKIVIAALDVVLVVINNVLALQFANPHVVKGDVEGSVLGLNEAIIGDHWYALLLGLGHDSGRRLAIDRCKHQDTITFRQVCIGLVLLLSSAPFGIVVVNSGSG